MRKQFLALLSLMLVATALFPASSADAQPSTIPFDGRCLGLDTFEIGCRVSGGSWSSAFADYAQANNISSTQFVGARVQYFPQGANPLEEVMYIVGPYLGASGEADDIDSIAAERLAVQAISPVMGPVRTRLRDLDVSIVYIGFGNFEDSQLPVAQRVAATKAAIRGFEGQRRNLLGQTPKPTALMGLSLGGVVGKIALRELENEGYRHGVESYLSFDSPHWGAYTPPSIQYVPIFLNRAFRWAERNVSWSEGLFDNPLDDARDGADQVTTLTLRSPIAQDLLTYNVAYEDWKAPNADYIRSRYRWLPRQTTRNVAIASGAIDGTRPELDTTYFSVDTGKASRSLLRIKLEMKTHAPSTANPRYFYGRLSHSSFLDRVHYRRRPNLSNFVIENFERAPCAYSTGLVESVAEQLEDQLDNADVWGDVNVNVTENRGCFIPTFSAVIGDLFVTGTPVGATSFDHVIGNGTNKEHLHVSGNMANELLSELDRVFAGEPAVSPPPTPPPTGGCDFWSGTHNLDDTRAMFPAQCGEAWNDQRHRCDYDGSRGWHCYGL